MSPYKFFVSLPYARNDYVFNNKEGNKV